MNSRNPELQRLLASLNGLTSLTPDISPSVQDHGISERQIGPQHNLTPTGAPDLAAGRLRGSGSAVTPAKTDLRPAQLLQANVERSRSSTPIPDASTITTWPAALKHVSKHLANDQKFISRIEHLVNEQHKHEDQWWTQRQALVAKHAGRTGSQNKVADILKELGGLAVPMAEVDEAADKNELEAFDKKVYKSLVQMAASFDSQLRKLGVPFYAIKHDLVISDDSKGNVTQKGKLDKGELRELQKRMLQHLEDLATGD